MRRCSVLFFFSNLEGTVAVCSFCVHRNPYLASSRSPWFVAQRWSGKEVALQVAVKGFFFFMWCYFLRFLRWDWTPLDSNFIICLSDLLKGRKCGTSPPPTARCNSRERERGGERANANRRKEWRSDGCHCQTTKDARLSPRVILPALWVNEKLKYKSDWT